MTEWGSEATQAGDDAAQAAVAGLAHPELVAGAEEGGKVGLFVVRVVEADDDDRFRRKTGNRVELVA